MSSLTYTKKCIVEHSTVEGLIAHHGHVEYKNWYINQVDNNLVDSTRLNLVDPYNFFLPFKYTSSTTVELLCVNQSQAEELMAIIIMISEQLNHPLTATTILDFSDTIESFEQDFSKVVVIEYDTVEAAGTTFNETQSNSLSWYHNEIVNYQADPTKTMVPYDYVSPTVCLVLVKDLQQAERFVEFEQKLAEEFNHSVTCTISDYSDNRIDFVESNLSPYEF